MKSLHVFFPVLTALIAITTLGCSSNEYNCRCDVDLTDTGGYSLDFDTVIALNARAEQIANAECEGLEQATDYFMPAGVAADNIEVTCALD